MAKKPVSQKWMLTFADLLSLILTFFVLIYSMADPIQFTNTYTNENNSAIQFDTGSQETKIELSNPQNYVEKSYLFQIFKNKIDKDEGMSVFAIREDGDKFVISADLKQLKPESIEALFFTINNLKNDKKIITKDIVIARDFALGLKKFGKIDNLSYFADYALQDKIEIVIYPQF